MTDHNQDSQSFSSLGLQNSKLLKALDQQGFTTPTEIQEQSIPHLLEGRDLIAQAKTGSGKTLAFALPSIERIKDGRSSGVLVLTPTRELAQQVAAEFNRFGGENLGTACIIGRQSYTDQIRAVNKGAKVIVATPGRLIDLLEGNKIQGFNPDTVVLDEADEMLNMGFIDAIKEIFSYLKSERQTIFFSATFPAQILKLAQKQQVNPLQIDVNKATKERVNSSIDQCFYIVKPQEKDEALLRLISFEQPEKAIVFCRTKRETEELFAKFLKENIKAKVLHGDLSQSDRSHTIKQLKSGLVKIVIATDVASRGIDIDNLTHVFNYQVPENYDRYVHRVGRTGRAGNSGRSLTLTTAFEWKSHICLRQVNRAEVKLEEIPSHKLLVKNRNKKLLETLMSTPVSSETRATCEKLLSEQDSFEFFCKLFSISQGEERQNGPERIGLNQKEIFSFLSRLGSKKSSFSRPSHRSKGGFSRSRSTWGFKGKGQRGRPERRSYS